MRRPSTILTVLLSAAVVLQVYLAFQAIVSCKHVGAFVRASHAPCRDFHCHSFKRRSASSRRAVQTYEQFQDSLRRGDELLAPYSEEKMLHEIGTLLSKLQPSVGKPSSLHFAKKLRRATDNTTYAESLTCKATNEIREACKRVLGECDVRVYGSRKKRSCSSQGLSDLDLDVVRRNSKPSRWQNVTKREKNLIRDQLKNISWVQDLVITKEVAIKFTAVEGVHRLKIDLVPKPQAKIRCEDFACMLGSADRRANEKLLMLFYNSKHPATFHAIRALKLLLPQARPQGILLENMVMRICWFYSYGQGPNPACDDSLWSALVALRTLEQIMAPEPEVFGEALAQDLDGMMKGSERSAERGRETLKRLELAKIDVRKSGWLERWLKNYTVLKRFKGQVIQSTGKKQRPNNRLQAGNDERRLNMERKRRERLKKLGPIKLGDKTYYRHKSRPRCPIEELLKGNDPRKLKVLYQGVLQKGNMTDDLVYLVHSNSNGLYNATVVLSDLRQPTADKIVCKGKVEKSRKQAKKSAAEVALRYWKEHWFEGEQQM